MNLAGTPAGSLLAWLKQSPRMNWSSWVTRWNVIKDSTIVCPNEPWHKGHNKRWQCYVKWPQITPSKVHKKILIAARWRNPLSIRMKADDRQKSYLVFWLWRVETRVCGSLRELSEPCHGARRQASSVWHPLTHPGSGLPPPSTHLNLADPTLHPETLAARFVRDTRLSVHVHTDNCHSLDDLSQW